MSDRLYFLSLQKRCKEFCCAALCQHLDRYSTNLEKNDNRQLLQEVSINAIIDNTITSRENWKN